MVIDLIGRQLLANPFDALGLEWQSIVLHLFNLVVLTVGLYFLLFKPVKKMIRQRQEKVRKIEKDNAALSEEVRQMKESTEKVLSDAKKEAASIQENAVRAANQKADDILARARDQAKNMIEQTERSLGEEKRNLQKEIERQIADVSVLVAEKVIEKSISPEGNKKLIEDSLAEWNSHEKQ